MLIFINSDLVPEESAKVSVLDRGVLYGDGVFETLRAYNGTIFHCNDHIDRLYQSAEAIYLKLPFTREYYKEALYKTLQDNGLLDAYLRLTVTRGIAEPGLDIGENSNPAIIIIPKGFTGYPGELYDKGIHAAIVRTRRMPASVLNPKIKSLNFLNNIMAKTEAAGVGAAEGFMLNIDGNVAEGTVSNIFIVRNGIISTPPPEIGILSGVTRSIVISLARENNIPMIEQSFAPAELFSADECFVTSTLYEVMPVTIIDNRTVGNGVPGEITKRLLSRFRELDKSA